MRIFVADSVLEGLPIQMTAQIHNIGISRQKMYRYSFHWWTMEYGSRIHYRYRQFQPIRSLCLRTCVNRGRRGLNEEIITIDPQQQIAEELKINNSYSFQFFVRKDTTAPSFDITFDGQRIYDGDYVLPHPPYELQFMITVRCKYAIHHLSIWL